MRKVRARGVRPLRLRQPDLAGVLAAVGGDEPVDRVVDVVGMRRRALVGEEDRLLRGVPDRGDVRHRVVGVGLVLEDRAVGRSSRDPVDPKGERVVRELHHGPVAVRAARPLALRVVFEVSHERGRGPGAAEVHVHALEEVRDVVGTSRDASVGARGGNRPVERVERRGAREALGVRRRRSAPIRIRPVPRREPAAAAQEVALEVVGLERDASGRVELSEDPPAVVEGVALRLAVLGLDHDRLGPAARGEADLDRPAQQVVAHVGAAVEAVPAEEGLALDVVQHPPRPRVDAVAPQAVPEDVVGVADGNPAAGIGHRQPVALEVVLDPGRVGPCRPVVGDGDDRPPERVEVGPGRRAGVSGGPLGGPLLFVAPASACTLVAPGRQVLVLRQPPEEAPDVGVGSRIGDEDGVVRIPGHLRPRVADLLRPGLVRVQGRDGPPRGVVEHRRADALDRCELEPGRRAEERLVRLDRLSLVVEDRPAGPDPPRIDDGAPVLERPALGPHLLLDLPAESVRVGEAHLHRRRVALGEVGLVGLSRQRADGRRRRVRTPARPFVRVEVVHDPCGRAPEKRLRVAERVRQERGERRVGEIGLDARERIAERLADLSHLGSRRDRPERVVERGRTVPVRVGHERGLEDTVVAVGSDDVSGGVLAPDEEQVVRVVVDDGVRAERRAESAREEEVLPRECQLLRRQIGGAGGVVDASGRDPPVRVAGVVDVAAFGEHRVRDARAVDRGDEPGRERELPALAGQAEGLEAAER